MNPSSDVRTSTRFIMIARRLSNLKVRVLNLTSKNSMNIRTNGITRNSSLSMRFQVLLPWE